MKKIAAVALAATLTTSCVANASAASRVSSIVDAFQNKDEIHILYNDKIVQYEDVKPVNTDGRVMIPFRSALENMGATVDYNDAERKVTAKKGDITINFTLMDDTIYVDKNGQQSTITMDVPMIIVEDRTLVPIRFMSNAFDMQVGWDGDTETVIIMDYSDYFDDFSTIMPNLTKMSELSKSEVSFNKGTSDFKLGFKVKEDSADLSADIDGKIEVENADGVCKVSVSGIDIDVAGFGVKDAKIDMIYDNIQAYVKTDIVEKLTKSLTGAGLELGLEDVIKADTWYKIDLYRLLNNVGMPEETKKVFEIMGSMSAEDKMDFAKVFEGLFKTEGEADIENALTIAMEMDVLEEMDKAVTFTEKDNGGYTVSMNLSSKDFMDIIKSMLSTEIDDSELSQIENMMKIDMSVKEDFDGKKAVTNAKVDMSINADGDIMSFKFEMNDTAENDSTVSKATMPTSSTDITDTLIEIVSEF